MCIICQGKSINYYNLEGMRELSCGYCEKVEEIPLIPGLKRLDCYHCPKLRKIPVIPGLKEIYCFNCPLLTDIPNIQGLKELECSWCPLISEIPRISGMEILGCRGCLSLVYLDFDFFSRTIIKGEDLVKSGIENNIKRKIQEKKEITLKLEADLGRATWEPTRAMRWCWDEEQKREFLDDIRDPIEKEEMKKFMF
jgi:hypothetical protein